MPQRINGSVFSDQVLTGSLKHYLLVGADFSASFDGEAPVYGSAAEEVARVITQKATIAIFNPYEIGISFALESNRSDWDTEELQAAIRALGSNVGFEGLNLSAIRVEEVAYRFLGSDFVFVVPDPNINHLIVNNTYFAASPTTLTLPDYTDEIIDVGSVIRIFKYEGIEVTIEAKPGQVIKDLTQDTSGPSYTYSYDEEIAIVFDGIKWAVYHDDKETIDLIIGLQAALDSKQNLDEKGQPNGYASLDSDGLVPASQLPSYVDDVLEFPDLLTFPNPGEFDKIYVDLSTLRIYRWSGSSYIELSTRPPDTDEVPEGSFNLYFTEQRARDSITNGTGVFYNSTSGEISIGQPVETTDDVTFNTVTAEFIGDITGNVTGQVSDISNHDTDDLTEGASNLYFTTQRARDSVSAGTGVSYNSATGVFSIGQPVGTTNDVTFNIVTADLVGDVTGQVSDISNFSTSDLSEGSNLYFTTQRARNSVSAGTGVTYNSASGVISIGQPVGTTDDVTFNTVTADVIGQVSDISNHDTDDLAEGLSNLYFTTQRARNSVSGGTGVTYNSATGVIAVGQELETTSDVTFNTVTADVVGDVTGQVSDISNHDTDDLVEGLSNLYFTEQRARDSVTNGTGVFYNSTSGEFSIGQPVETTSDVTFNTVTADVVGQVSDISNHDTDDLAEGATNLYFTEQRARDSITNGTGVSYDSATGTVSIGQAVETTSDVVFNQVTSNLIGQVSDISNFSTDDLVEGTTNLYYTDARVENAIRNVGFKNVLRVDKTPIGPNEFSTIADALAEIAARGDLASDNPYQVELGAGEFFSDPFTIPRYVTLKGQGDSTVLKPNDLTQNFVTMSGDSYLDDVTLAGPTSPNTYSVNIIDTFPGAAVMFTVQFTTAWGYISIVNNSTAPLAAIITNTIVSGVAGATLPINVSSTSTGPLVAVFNGFAHLLINPAINISEYFNISGPATQCVLNELRIEGTIGNIDTGFVIENGPQVIFTTVSLVDMDTSVYVPNVGAGPFIRTSAYISDAQTWDILVENPLTTGSVTGTIVNDRINIVTGSELIISALSTAGDSVGFIQIGDVFQGDQEDRLINLSKLVRSSAALGIVAGGQLSVGPAPNEVTIAGGTGFVESDIDDYVFEVFWEATSVTVADGEELWLVVNPNGTLSTLSAPPANLFNFMLLGRVYADDGEIQFIDNISNRSDRNSSKQETFFRDALGPVYSAGSITSFGSGPYNISVSSGRFYYGSNSYTPTGGDDITFTQSSRNGTGGTDDIDTQTVPVKFDNNSGTLQDPTAGYYVKHALYVVGDGAVEEYYLVVGQEEFQNVSVAEQANLPNPPNFIKESFALIAAIIVKEGDADIVSIFDERPVIGFQATGVAAATTHGNLLGLSADDHPQYLREDGTRALSGNLNLGNNNIVNVGTLNSVTVEAHASRHVPNGADPLPTGVPSTIGTANSEGVQNVFARQDHIHNHGDQPGGTLHAAATQTTNGFMSAADKTKLDTITTDDVNEGSELYFTEQRARDSISGGTGVTYNNATGVISIGQAVETTSDVTFNTVTADLIGNVTGQVSDISNQDTDALSEGVSNLYFTTSRARNSVSAGTGVTYNPVTGIISIGQAVETTSDVTFNTVTADLIGDVTGQVSDISNQDTDALTEGLSNLYFTTQRARDSVSGGTGVTYNNATGVVSVGQAVETTSDVTFNTVTADIVGQVSDISNFDTDDLSEGATNLYFTTPRARNSVSAGTGVSYSASTGVISIGQSVGTTDNVEFNNVIANLIGNVTGQVSDISNFTTTDLTEGSNLYFTDSRARNSVSAGTGVSYNSATGIISIGQAVETTSDVTFNTVTADVTGNVTGNVTGQVSDLSNQTTDALAEGTTNFYYTAERADDRLSQLLASSPDITLVYDDNGNILTIGTTATPDNTADLIVKRSADNDFDITAINIDTVDTSTRAEGRIRWNSEFAGPEVGLGGGNVNLQIGQEKIVRVYNETGSAITEGQVVRIIGSDGTRITVDLPQATSALASDTVLGVATEDIPNLAEGFVTSYGRVNNLDTSAYTEGDKLYLSQTTPGGLTNLVPPAPNKRIYIGIVVRSLPANGIIFVQPGFNEEVGSLSNVDLTNIQDNQTLVWDTDRFVNSTPDGLYTPAAHGSTHSPLGSDPLATASAATISAISSNTEGNANSFARSDHTHNISTGAPVTQRPEEANAEGTSGDLARADHVHRIAAASAVTTSNNTNAEGNADSFARSNHTHQLSSNAPTTGQVLSWDGSDWVATTVDTGPAGSSFGASFGAFDFEFTNNADWQVSNAASRIRDPLNQSIRAFAFDDTTEEGLGFFIETPPASAELDNITYTLWVKRRTASTGSNAVFRAHNRPINSNAPVGPWNTNANFPTVTSLSTLYQRVSFTVPLATAGYSDDTLHQVEITRNSPSGTDDVQGDVLISRVTVSFS